MRVLWTCLQEADDCTTQPATRHRTHASSDDRRLEAELGAPYYMRACSKLHARRALTLKLSLKRSAMTSVKPKSKVL